MRPFCQLDTAWLTSSTHLDFWPTSLYSLNLTHSVVEKLACEAPYMHTLAPPSYNHLKQLLCTPCHHLKQLLCTSCHHLKQLFCTSWVKIYIYAQKLSLCSKQISLKLIEVTLHPRLVSSFFFMLVYGVMILLAPVIVEVIISSACQ